MAPGLVDDAGTRKALVAHSGVRTIIELWDRLDVALFGIGGPSWSSALVGEGIARQLENEAAVGEVLVAPFDLDGRFVCPALRERVIALDARRLRRIPVAIGVAAGESKVRPILGALRAGTVRTLVTDVATAEAVVALDLATLAAQRAVHDEPASTGGPRTGPGHDRGQGRPGVPRRTSPRARTERLRARRERRSRVGRTGPGGVVVGGRERGPGAARQRPRRDRVRRRRRPRARRSPRSTREAKRPVARSPSSTRAPPPRPPSWPPRPGFVAGRSVAFRRRSGWSGTSRPWLPPRPGTSRPGSGWRSG